MPDVPVALSQNPRADAPERPRLSPEEARAAIRAAEVALLDERRQLTLDELGRPGRRCPTRRCPSSPRSPTRCAWRGAGPRSRSRASCRPRPAAAPRTATSAASRRSSRPRCRPRRSSTPTRCSRAAEETAGARGLGVLHRARRPRPRRAHHAAHPRARARWCATRSASTSPSAPASSPTTRPAASPRAGCTATTTTSRPPGRYFPEIVTTHTGRSASRPASWSASTAWSCAAACCSAWARSIDQRIELLGAAPRRRAGRGAAQLPQPPPGHAARRPPAGRAARGHPLDRPVPPRPARRSSCATPAAARSRCASCRPWA